MMNDVDHDADHNVDHDVNNDKDNDVDIVKTQTVKETLEKVEKKKVKTCLVILSKGKRKGLECDRKIIQDCENFCKFHLGKSTTLNFCNVILTKGERKNQTCNRKVVEILDIDGNIINQNETLCKIHKNLEDKRPFNPFVDNEIEIVSLKNQNQDFIESANQNCRLNLDKMDPFVKEYLFKTSG